MGKGEGRKALRKTPPNHLFLRELRETSLNFQRREDTENGK